MTSSRSAVVMKDDMKGKNKEIQAVQDQGFFEHETGDTYDGFFEIKKKDQSCKMQGPGVYKTAEGDTYTGYWAADKLAVGDPEVTISYHSGAVYQGPLVNWCYNGKGSYTYPDKSILTGTFSENCPVGDLTLTDPNGHIWYAKAELGTACFQPMNHYYDFLEENIVRPKKKKRAIPQAQVINNSPIEEPIKKKVVIKSGK